MATYLDASGVAYTSMAVLQAADLTLIEYGRLGYSVSSGCVVSPSGTAGKVDMTAGIILLATTELNVTAVSASTTTITSLADSVYPRWVLLEIDSSGVLQFNSGAASSNTPPKPTPTTGRVAVAWLYVPVNATTVDAAVTTPNGAAKLIDAGQRMTVHPARKLGLVTSQAGVSNPTSLTTALNSTISVPANSLSIGDVFRIRTGGLTVNNSASTSIEFQILWGATAIGDWTTGNLATSAAFRGYSIQADFLVTTLGASGTMWPMLLTGSIAGPGTPAVITETWNLSGASYTIDTTVVKAIDFKVKFGTTSAGAAISCAGFHVEKIPV